MNIKVGDFVIWQSTNSWWSRYNGRRCKVTEVYENGMLGLHIEGAVVSIEASPEDYRELTKLERAMI